MIEPFQLLETFRWTPDEGYFLLDRHLQRLSESARYFGFACSSPSIVAALADAAEGADRPLRVRLLLDRRGHPRVESSPLEMSPVPVRVALAARPIDHTDPFVFHKTTNRAHLERERLPSFDDTVLWNPARHVTETINCNLVIEIDGRQVTPPVDCGLLAGTMRAELLARGKIVEAQVSIEQFVAAPRFWLINSVRGRRDAVLEK